MAQGRIGDLAPYAEAFGRSLDDVNADLESLCALLVKWQRVQNLVSRETLADLWTRHVLDSLQLLPFIPGAGTLVDLGSGGGFPALPLAIAFKGHPVRIHMVESNGRKCAYLRAVIRELALPATVHQARIEHVSLAELGAVDVVTARALADISLLFPLMYRFWGPNTKAVLHKGREFGEELKRTDSAWIKSVVTHSSTTDSDGVIAEIACLAPKG